MELNADRSPLPGRPSISPPSLYKCVELSLSHPSLPELTLISSHSLARHCCQSSSSSPEFAGVHRSSPHWSQPDVEDPCPLLLRPTSLPSHLHLPAQARTKVEDNPKLICVFSKYFWFNWWIVCLFCCNMNMCDPKYMCMCAIEFLVDSCDY
jgi:hypothetical protein